MKVVESVASLLEWQVGLVKSRVVGYCFELIMEFSSILFVDERSCVQSGDEPTVQVLEC